MFVRGVGQDVFPQFARLGQDLGIPAKVFEAKTSETQQVRTDSFQLIEDRPGPKLTPVVAFSALVG
jgi:hypothetical protein